MLLTTSQDVIPWLQSIWSHVIPWISVTTSQYSALPGVSLPTALATTSLCNPAVPVRVGLSGTQAFQKSVAGDLDIEGFSGTPLTAVPKG